MCHKNYILKIQLNFSFFPLEKDRKIEVNLNELWKERYMHARNNPHLVNKL